MKKVLTLAFGLFAAAQVFAQEQAVYSQYPMFPVLVNPGYTGFENEHQFLANVRSTWAGFPGRPNTYTLMYNGPVGDKLALGGAIFSEKIGALNTLKLQLNYAFRFQVQKAKIGLGLTTEFINRRLDNKTLTDPNIQRGDDILEANVDGQRIFDASAGAHILYDEKFFVSLAFPNTARVRLDALPVAGGDEQRGSLFQHSIFQLGYIINVPGQNFKVVPSLAVRKVRDTPTQIDLNLQGRFLDDKLIAGLTFRPSTGGSMALMLGTKYRKAQLYYSYDIAFGRFQSYSSGSHEFTVAYNIERKKPGVKPAEEESLYNN